MQTDRHLLLGLLALQCGFITKDQLVSAFSIWTSDKSRSLEQILNEHNAITAQQQSLLAALVEEHLKQHGNNPEKSLAALSSLPAITHDLRQLADPDLNASLAAIQLKERDNTLATTAILENAHARSSRFIILRKHAKGGLGQVSVALDSELNRHVALKEMLAKCADDPASQQRFVQEAEITGQLEHPGIVPVYGLGTYGDGKPYYAMRFVEGDNLRHAIERFHKERKPSEQLTGPRAVEFRNLLGRFVDVCNAIEYAHSRKVLHRDLKPDNILLGPYGETLVVDWGLAKALGKNEESVQGVPVRPVKPRSGSYGETLDGSAIGTPAYMSPEQAEGKLQSLGPATDVYSLGATLFALLTGAPPIQGDTAVDTLEKVRRGEIGRPRTHWASIPQPLEAVCMKAMALKPSDRYPSAKAVAEEIERWLADEPVNAFQEPFTARARRWIKRHPVVVTSTAVALVLGICAVSIIAYQQGAHANELKDKNETISNQVVELRKRNEQVEKERGRAEEREKDAIAAVRKFGDAVTNNPELKNNPKLDSLRKDLLREPLSFFKQLRDRLSEEKEIHSESLARLADASNDLALLTDEIGDKQDALLAYQHAKQLYERLVQEDPKSVAFRRLWAASHAAVGDLLGDSGKLSEALSSLKAAKEIQEELVRENPQEQQFQSDLSTSYNNMATILRELGRIEEAFAAHEKAKSIREKLVHDHPTNADFQNDLAYTNFNLGNFFSQTKKPSEALAAFTEAKRIWQQLVQAAPKSNEFRSGLARVNINIGAHYMENGKATKALEPLEDAAKIQEQLVSANPSVIDYQVLLATTQGNLGNLHYFLENDAESEKAFTKAKERYESLLEQNPSVIEFQFYLASTLNNLASLKMKLGQFAKAKELMIAAIEHQKRLRAIRPEDPTTDRTLKSLYINLGIAAKELGDSDLAAEASKNLAELTSREPETVKLDQRLKAVADGEAAKDSEELFALSLRAYHTQRYLIAVRILAKAFERDPSLAEDMELQLPYNAACCALSAANGEDSSKAALDDAAKSKLRGQALTWLRQELSLWEKTLESDLSPESWKIAAETLGQWVTGDNLATTRDPEKLATLPESERKEWEAFWTEVKALEVKVSAGSTPADTSAPPPTQTQPAPSAAPPK